MAMGIQSSLAAGLLHVPNEGGFRCQLLEDEAFLESLHSNVCEGHSADSTIPSWSCCQNDLLLLQGHNFSCIA